MRLDPDEAAERVYNFLHTLTLEAQMLARACGKTSAWHSWSLRTLPLLTMEASAMAQVPLAGTDYTVGVRIITRSDERNSCDGQERQERQEAERQERRR